ncbi:hypothetical protein JCM10914A_02160 [Paenibacillus sp. JCM 10914]|uniref:ABC transporter permease n=1 Tax=Paenibacillus sp. JCM 10914 TaxID=1236974 RepID=UPI0003CC9B69|nr:ABC transporter permease [Paenibacillus sp. JCM 10914]GAE06853.1 multidrug ABC transporter permease [Paenibacillus sp. JCM 10914]
MLLFRMTYFALLRLIREPVGQLMLVVLPLVIISVIGYVIGAYQGMEGVPPLDRTAVLTIIGVQFFGGTYLMSYLNDDLLQTRKWRIYSLPIHVTTYSSSLILSCSLFSTLQGLVLVLFTTWVFGVEWGPLAWVLLVLFIFSLFSQFVHVALTLSTSNFKLAERLSEVIGLGFMVLTGLIFPMPNTSFFDFMSSYGNPVSLGEMAIFGMLDHHSKQEAFISMGILLAAALCFMLISAWLGRRRLV